VAEPVTRVYSSELAGLRTRLELRGAGEVDANGEAVIRGTIQPHGAAEATQYYLPRFRAWDNSGSDALSPFVALAATDFKVSDGGLHTTGRYISHGLGRSHLAQGGRPTQLRPLDWGCWRRWLHAWLGR
jgi:hypothetical protein